MNDAACTCFLCTSLCDSVSETELDNVRPSCSTGPSLSLSATFITKAELSKQKIIETNKLMPCEAEYCNCAVRECVFSHWINTVSVSLLCSLTSCYFIVIHTKVCPIFVSASWNFKQGQLSDSAIERAVCQGGLVLCGLVSHGCCNKPYIISSHIFILPKPEIFFCITLTSVTIFLGIILPSATVFLLISFLSS